MSDLRMQCQASVVKAVSLVLSLFFLLKIAFGEDSFLGDVEIIKAKIPGFVGMHLKNNIQLAVEDLEKVNSDDPVNSPIKKTTISPSEPKIGKPFL